MQDLIDRIMNKIADWYSSLLRSSYTVVSKRLLKVNVDRLRRYMAYIIREGVYGKDRRDDKMMAVSIGRLRFPNPIGLAAGIDKRAEVFDHLVGIGFGFGEIGSFTNSRERPLFRPVALVEDEALLDRSGGFPNPGIRNVLTAVAARRGRKSIVGISLADDHQQQQNNSMMDVPGQESDSFETIDKNIRMASPYVDYLVINISHPISPACTIYQSHDNLEKLIITAKAAVVGAAPINTPLLFIKLSADLNDQAKEVAATLAVQHKLDGLIIAGGTTKRLNLKSTGVATDGVVSGRPILEMNTELVRDFYRLTKGRVPIIASGGVFSGADAYQKIKAGACLVQICSALYFRGPTVVRDIKTELMELLKADGYTSVIQAIGADFRKGAKPAANAQPQAAASHPAPQPAQNPEVAEDASAEEEAENKDA